MNILPERSVLARPFRSEAIPGIPMLLAAAWAFALLMSLAVGAGEPEAVEYVLEFPAEEARISGVEGYDRIMLSGCDFSLEAGAPEVPVRSVQIGLPAGSVVQEWAVEALSWEELPGEFDLVAVQPPRILSLSL